MVRGHDEPDNALSMARANEPSDAASLAGLPDQPIGITADRPSPGDGRTRDEASPDALSGDAATAEKSPSIADPPPAIPYLTSEQTPDLMRVIPNDDRPYWVAWNRVRGIGPVRFKRLLDHFGDAASAWVASPTELRGMGFDARTLEDIVRQRQQIDPRTEMRRLDHLAVAALILSDEEYPQLLREITAPPPVLYVRGILAPQDARAIAIVGTRGMTTYGRQVTERLSRDLATQGMTIISGLARGIDGVAHAAALAAGGRTIAVLGCGVDLVYPPEHAQLAARIVRQGAIVSDYGVGMPPEAGNFPARNRIISGLALATVIAEAPRESGALLTADFAIDQGRDVMAVPGSIFSKASAGCHNRIQEGALLVQSAEDIINALNMHLLPEQMDMRELMPLDPAEQRLLEMLALDARHIDDLCRDSSLPIATVSSALAMLELKGLARNLGGMLYARV